MSSLLSFALHVFTRKCHSISFPLSLLASFGAQPQKAFNCLSRQGLGANKDGKEQAMGFPLYHAWHIKKPQKKIV
jgi:hypothetical protein